MQKRILFFFLFFGFLLVFYFLRINKASAAFVSCNGGNEVCEGGTWTACNGGVIGTCNYNWGNQSRSGTCYDYDFSPKKYLGECTVSQACCMPGQNGCPSCDANTTCNTNCDGAPGWKDPVACPLPAQCSGWNGNYCTGTIRAKYCQTPNVAFCIDDPLGGERDYCTSRISCPQGETENCYPSIGECDANCAVPRCQIIGVDPNAKQIGVAGANLVSNGLDKYQLTFSPSGAKTEGIPPEEKTIYYSDVSGSPTSVSIQAESSTGAHAAVSCGSANLTGGSCSPGSTPCSTPGEYTDQCNGGQCNTASPPKCATCTAPSVDCSGTCPGLTAEIQRDGTLVAEAVPVSSVHKIDFRLFRTDVSPTVMPCRSIGMQSTNTGGSTYDLWWGGNGCGTVTYDSLAQGFQWQDTDRTDPKLNRFNSSYVKRGEYYIQDFWLTDRFGSDICSYVINCNEYTGTGSSTDLIDLPQDDAHRPPAKRSCETYRAPPSNYVIPSSVKYSCGPEGQLYLRMRTGLTTGRGQIRLYYPYTPIGTYAGNADWTRVRTDLCIQQQGTTCGTDDSCNTANDNQNGRYQCDLARSNQSQLDLLYFTGQTDPDPNNANRTKTWQANVVGRSYTASVTTSVASGNCTCTASLPLGTFNPKFHINGTVFKDWDGDNNRDPEDVAFTGTFYIASPTGANYTYANGFYEIRGLPSNTYNVILDDVSGYRITTPNSTRTVTVGPTQGDKENIDFGIAPFRTISGNVIIDVDGDGIKDPQDTQLYNNTDFTITVEGGEGFEYVTKGNGTYTVNKATADPNWTYNVSFSSPPGYVITMPQTTNVYSNLKVGYNCTAGGAAGASCSGGSIINLDFLISEKSKWFQGKGGDMRIDSGFGDPITKGANPPYASLNNSNGTPGVVFTGNTNAYFGNGQGQASLPNWIVGGGSYPDLYPSNKLKASYNYMNSYIKQSKTDLSTICTISSCTLPAGLSGGVYYANLGGPGYGLFLNAYNFPNTNSDYVFLIDGDLRINGNIDVPSGATASFFVSGDIIVESSVGVDPSLSEPSLSAPNIEGIFSAGGNFELLKTSQECQDKRLNIQGSVIVNTALGTGKLDYDKRDLCENSKYPIVYIEERPDFYLNLPSYVLTRNWIWQEVAP